MARSCQRCGKNRQDKFFTGPRGRICTTCQSKSRSTSSHRRRVEKTYGLDQGEYDVLFAAQNGACAICKGVRKQRLSVDHDHKNGLVRGLLCRMCNGRLLTAARDSSEVLRTAANYLDDPPAVGLIGSRYATEEADNNRRQRKKRS